MFKKYGWYICGIILSLLFTFLIATDNQSIKTLIAYIIIAITVITMIYINKKY